MTLVIFGLVLLGFLIGLAIGLLSRFADDTEKRIQALEDAQAKRLNHTSAAAIEDSLSALINATRLHQELKNDAEALGYWLDKSAEFSRGARGNAPYDMEASSGNKTKRY